MSDLIYNVHEDIPFCEAFELCRRHGWTPRYRTKKKRRAYKQWLKQNQ